MSTSCGGAPATCRSEAKRHSFLPPAQAQVVVHKRLKPGEIRLAVRKLPHDLSTRRLCSTWRQRCSLSAALRSASWRSSVSLSGALAGMAGPTL